MKKFFQIAFLASFFSVPPPQLAFAEASWYGSIRTGLQNEETSGLADRGSRWGIKGSSEIAEGLTAVYRYERSIDSTNAEDTGGRLSYVGLSGNFGTITVGQVWSATYNSVGVITDNSGAFGDSETDLRIGNAVSYSVSVGNLSLQADVVMNKDKVIKDITQARFQEETINSGGYEPLRIEHASPGHPYPCVPPDPYNLCKRFGIYPAEAYNKFTYDRDNDIFILDLGTVTKKTVDSYQFGVTLDNIMGSGKLAFAHKRHEATRLKGNKKSSNFIAAEYPVGSITLHLGVAQHREIMGNFCLANTLDKDDFAFYGLGEIEVGERLPGCIDGKKIQTTVFTGVRGSVGDSGVNYVVQIRSKKTSGKQVDVKDYPTPDPGPWGPPMPENLRGQALPADKHSPWIFGLSRSLGGGASVHFEYGNKDRDGEDNQSALWLQVDF